MPTIRDNTSSERIEQHLEPAQVFELLANDRRQRILRYLSHTVGATDIDDLAEEIAILEKLDIDEHAGQIRTTLVHVHLPKLERAGVIRQDPCTGAIDLLHTAEAVLSHLEFPAAENI